MNYIELEQKSKSIIDEAIENISLILEDVEKLDKVIKENQIRGFKNEWRQVLLDGGDPYEKINDPKFVYRFRYLINRMNEENQIKGRIIEITKQKIKELTRLWSK